MTHTITAQDGSGDTTNPAAVTISQILAVLPITDEEWDAAAFATRLNAIYADQRVVYQAGEPADISGLVGPPVIVAALAVHLASIKTGRTVAEVVEMLLTAVRENADGRHERGERRHQFCSAGRSHDFCLILRDQVDDGRATLLRPVDAKAAWQLSRDSLAVQPAVGRAAVSAVVEP